MNSSKLADMIEASVKKSIEEVFKPLNKRLARLEAKIGSDLGLIGSAQIRIANTHDIDLTVELVFILIELTSNIRVLSMFV